MNGVTLYPLVNVITERPIRLRLVVTAKDKTSALANFLQTIINFLDQEEIFSKLTTSGYINSDQSGKTASSLLWQAITSYTKVVS